MTGQQHRRPQGEGAPGARRSCPCSWPVPLPLFLFFGLVLVVCVPSLVVRASSSSSSSPPRSPFSSVDRFSSLNTSLDGYLWPFEGQNIRRSFHSGYAFCKYAGTASVCFQQGGEPGRLSALNLMFELPLDPSMDPNLGSSLILFNETLGFVTYLTTNATRTSYMAELNIPARDILVSYSVNTSTFFSFD